MKYLFGHSFETLPDRGLRMWIDGHEFQATAPIIDVDIMESYDFNGWLYFNKMHYYIINPMDPIDQWLGMDVNMAWGQKIKEKPPWLAGVIRELKVSGGL